MIWLRRVINLYNLVRTGWLLRGIPPSQAETVAQHTFLVAFTSLMISRDVISKGLSVDLGKVLSMALVHDIPEAVEGDIVKWVKDRVRGDVNKLDLEALSELGLNDLKDLMLELNSEGSVEALIVKICDNLATYIQGRVYYELGFKEVNDILEGSLSSINEYVRKLPKGYNEIVKNIVNKVIRSLS
ncbi:MAG TPA: HD domain-containing protein, partial [Acidilobales archaeon]|nr:HD domain-containing protein [Acidilobales archaeon]